MAFNIFDLMHPLLFSIAQVEPVWADLDGGVDRLPDLADITSRIRSDIMKKNDSRRAIFRDNASDLNNQWRRGWARPPNRPCYPSCQLQVRVPHPPPAESLQDLYKLRGLV